MSIPNAIGNWTSLASQLTGLSKSVGWRQTINKARRPNSSRFTRGFLIVTPGITIRDRLRVLQPNDPDSYYAGWAFAEFTDVYEIETGFEEKIESEFDK